jgi:hypothetical protein
MSKNDPISPKSIFDQINNIRRILNSTAIPDTRDKGPKPDNYVSNLKDDLKRKLFTLPASGLPKESKLTIAKVIYEKGKALDCVLFLTEKQYEDWYPYNQTKLLLITDKGFTYNAYHRPYRLMIKADKILDIVKCPFQLPPKWCNKIYKFGEGYMGGYLFTIHFKDHSMQAYLTGGVVDFIRLPSGYTFNDIVEVKPRSKDRWEKDYPNYQEALPFVWCVYI